MIRLVQGIDKMPHYQLITSMHQLRAQVFNDRLGWAVNVVNGQEIDLRSEIGSGDGFIGVVSPSSNIEKDIYFKVNGDSNGKDRFGVEEILFPSTGHSCTRRLRGSAYMYSPHGRLRATTNA